MLKVFLSSHGRLASGIKSTLSILMGENERLTTFDAYIDETTVQEHLDEFFATVTEEDEVLLCSDLYGGSVNTAMCQYLDRPNTRLVAGVNLNFVLQVMLEESIDDDRLAEIISEARNGLQQVIIESTEGSSSEDDFF